MRNQSDRNKSDTWGSASCLIPQVRRGGSGGLKQTVCPSPLPLEESRYADLYLVPGEVCVWGIESRSHTVCIAECASICFTLLFSFPTAWIGHCRCLLLLTVCMYTYAFPAPMGPSHNSKIAPQTLCKTRMIKLYQQNTNQSSCDQAAGGSEREKKKKHHKPTVTVFMYHTSKTQSGVLVTRTPVWSNAIKRLLLRGKSLTIYMSTIKGVPE